MPITMPLQLIKHTEPRRFYNAVIDHLVRSEAECCVLIGLARRMAENGYAPVSPQERDQPLLWTVQNGQAIELVAMQTLKKAMTVTRASPAAMDFLAEAMAANHWPGSQMNGATPSIQTLVGRYASLTGRKAAIAVKRRVYQIERVKMPRPAGGSMRRCGAGDRAILARFITGFQADTHQPSPEDPLVQADRAIDDGRMHFWTDPEPVALAAAIGPTPNGIRIGAVYTPPEFRGRGYASNLVATLTQHLLDHGSKFCFLFTDQANPTSNSIYQKMGYQAVSDSERWEFV